MAQCRLVVGNVDNVIISPVPRIINDRFSRDRGDDSSHIPDSCDDRVKMDEFGNIYDAFNSENSSFSQDEDEVSDVDTNTVQPDVDGRDRSIGVKNEIDDRKVSDGFAVAHG